MRKLNFLWALLASALFVVGCEPNIPTPDEPTPGPNDGKPEITLTEVEATFDSFTFEVTTTVPGTLGYAVVAEGFDTPKLDEMFAANSQEVTDKATFTVSGLNDASNYTLFAVLRAKDGGVLSAPKNLKFTTADDGVASPIKINGATYNSITFTIEIEGSYVFQCIDKAYLEYNSLTPEDYISTLGIGIPSKGEITVEWTDGNKYGNYEMRVREDSDYYVIAAIANGQEVVGDIFYKTVRTPKRPVSTAGLTTELTDITSTSVKIKTTPDSEVSEYYVLVRDKVWSDSIIDGHGESMLQTLVERENSGSWRLTAANEQVWSGLSHSTEYICHVLVKDKKDGKSLTLIPFTTAVSSMSAPVVEASLTNHATAPHNTLNLNIFCDNASSVMFAFNTKADVDNVRQNKNYSDSDIVRNYGMELSAEQVEAIRTTGLTLLQEDLFPEVEYVAVISIKNAEQTETVKVTSKATKAKATPARVESDLFTSLLGEWKVSYSLVQYNNNPVSINGVKVTIAKGADSDSEEYYRSQNRLVIQGWPFNVRNDGMHDPQPYYSPSDLKEINKYWKNNPSLAMRDYGPKIFLEIAEGDVVTVPSSRGEYLYNWSEDGTFYFYGADRNNGFSAPTTFPVTISEDGNTITINECKSGAEFDYGVYYPSVFRKNSALDPWAITTSKIILERVK